LTRNGVRGQVGRVERDEKPEEKKKLQREKRVENQGKLTSVTNFMGSNRNGGDDKCT